MCRRGNCSTALRSDVAARGAPRHAEDEPRRACAHPALRNADGLPARDASASAGARFVVTLVELPLVLPPAVAGIGAARRVRSSRGLLGGSLEALGRSLAVHPGCRRRGGRVRRQPLLHPTRRSRPSRPSTRRCSTLRGRSGRGPGRVSPASRCRSRRAGSPPASRSPSRAASGEFGATIIFAGSLRGVTQTLSLAIYARASTVDFDAALALGALLVVVSIAVLLVAKLLLSWTRSRSRSRHRSSRLRSPTRPRRRRGDARARRARRGAGKSSLLRAIAGLDASDEGGSRSTTTSGSTANAASTSPPEGDPSGSSSRTTPSSRT